jgi:hypothetical protein
MPINYDEISHNVLEKLFLNTDNKKSPSLTEVFVGFII